MKSSIFVNLIALIALALASFSIWQVSQLQRTNHKKLTQLQWQYQQSTGSLTQQQQLLSENQQSIKQLKQQLGRQPDDWILAETLYLLNIAHYNLTFMRDIKLATILMQNADKNLANLNDPDLLKVRQLIANKLAQIQGKQHLDISGILLRLNALSGEIPKLPLIPKQLPQSDDKTDNLVTQKRWWDRLLNNFKSVIIVHRLQKPKPPLLAPDQQIYLVENIQYQITQAQWAVLHNDQALYQASLAQVITWIKQYIDINTREAKQILQSLEALNRIKIAVKLPDIGSITTALQQALATRQQTTSVGSSPEKTKKPKNLSNKKAVEI